ncbi:Neuronal acetylcholine receptor subunit alpha-7 [Fasciolopsis buskii]|uniref:Neuronal acetylcholine receptor subunit alpha-7 n=1 Tax=Fasciolopsis buskii TaxID=27845 RepID=A0A8E0RYP7_9TREM|nr:Neuronal acetylcholine receptor subunit alpha-7 [Fasciolopsis buski]
MIGKPHWPGKLLAFVPIADDDDDDDDDANVNDADKDASFNLPVLVIFHCNCKQNWHDYHFRWDPMDYGNVSVINLPYAAVWRPDILLYNCADEKFDRTFPTNVIMKHDGKVQWMPPGLFKSTCNIDISWFPFDVQNCTLKFGSWTYNGDQIDFRITCEANDTSENCSTRGEVDLSEYSNNGEFHLDGAYVVRFAQRYDCCQFDFIDIKMTIQLQRRALYYVFNLIVPCLLISGMSLMVFMLPPDAGEKISLGVTILLSLTMFLQLVADKLPQTSEAIPLIGIYFCCTMIMCSLSIVFTVLVLNYHHRSADVVVVPHWIKLVINTYLARLMFMNPPQRSPIVVPDDDEDSLNSVGQLFRDAEVLSSQNHCSQSPDLINSNFLAVKVTSPNQTNMGMANQIPPDGSRKTEKQRIGAPPRTTVNEAVTTARQNSDLGTSVQRDRIQVRSSRSLLANVLNLDDDFRASALVPAQQWTEKMPTNLGRVSSYSHHKRFSEFAEPPPYSFEQSGMNSHLEPFDESDALCPDGLSEISANGAISPESYTSEQKQSPISPAMLSAYRTDLEQILTELRFITSKIRDNEQEALVNLEWKFAARVIDRFCLIVFGALNFFATAAILLSAPNLIASFKP